jgi:excisionase family DNA binding protein
MSKVVDLDRVRRGKAELRRAVELGKARGSQPARPVPVAELIAGGRVTLTVPELATLTGLHQLTIRRAIARGELKAANGGGRSQYRISRADAESWWRGRGGGTLLGAAPMLEMDAQNDTSNSAAAILSGLDSDDPRARNAAIMALSQADAQTSALVETEVARSVAEYSGPEDDWRDWRALDGEPFHFPEEEAKA